MVETKNKFMQHAGVLKCFSIVSDKLPGLAIQTMLYIDEQVLLRDEQMRKEGFEAGWIRRSNYENHWGIFEDIIPDIFKKYV